LGSSSQTPIQTKILLLRYLTSLNPKRVVFEVYPESFGMDGVESAIDLIANDRNDFLTIDMAFEIQNIKTCNTLLYGLMADAIGRYERYHEPLEKGPDKYVDGGFVEKKVSTVFNPMSFDNKNIIYRDYQMEAFTDIVELLKARNIDLVIVFAPVAKCYYDSFLDLESFDRLMSSYSSYYNANELMRWDDTLFYDYHHLNQKGVELFNHECIKILSAHK
jgi:hypothetical protein